MGVNRQPSHLLRLADVVARTSLSTVEDPSSIPLRAREGISNAKLSKQPARSRARGIITGTAAAAMFVAEPAV